MAKTHPAKQLASVFKWLESNADARGITYWQKRSSALRSYGIGLTRLRSYAKQLGKDHDLAQALWDSDCYDARVLGLLIDDPKQMTIEQVERMLEAGLAEGMLVHVFTACGAPLSKTRFAFELVQRWVEHADPLRRQCGYALLYELSKKNPPGMDDAYLLERIGHIAASIHQQPMWVREAMNTALMGMGKRNLRLNAAALAAARTIGPVDIDYGDDNSCQPLDVVKHLAAESLQRKLASPKT